MESNKTVESTKRVETLEGEFKLLKGELKQTLSSVRDYLLSSELPASEYATIMAALGGGGGGQGQPMQMKMAPDENKDISEETEQELEEMPSNEESFEEKMEEMPAGEESLEEKMEELPEDEELVEEEESLEPESELAGPEMGEMKTEEELRVREELSQPTPPVNLLANLIRWVSNAKREIGTEQLTTFLEVYGISGHLSPELKEIIMYLADIAPEQSEAQNTAEIWSRLISELHGILTGGDAPLHQMKPWWGNGGGGVKSKEIKETELEESPPKVKSLKLKLVFPDGEATDQELLVNLSEDGNKDSS